MRHWSRGRWEKFACAARAGFKSITKSERSAQTARRLKQGDYISIDGTAGEVFAGEVTTAPSEIVQVLVDRSLDAKEKLNLSAVRKIDEVGGRISNARRSHERRHARAGQQTRSRLAPKGSGFAAPSTCFSKATGSMQCAR